MSFLLVIHVLSCALLIIAILFQVGRGASTGAVFGGGVRTVFGPMGATSFLGKVIIVLSIIVFLATFSLAILSRGGKPPRIESSKKAEVTSLTHLLS